MPATGTLLDRYGLPLTTTSPQAVMYYVEGVDQLLAGNAGAATALGAAIAADEGLALAHIALAREEQFAGRPVEARARAARARELLGGVTPRERGHVEALAAAVEGDSPRALELVHEHLADFPRDAFVLSMANGVYGLIGFSGRAERNDEQMALLAPLAGHYGDDWWFLSALAFAHNELFDFEPARRLVDRSLALYDRNAHGAHTFAHVLFETGDPLGGASYLDRWLESYDRGAQLHTHLSWHLALFDLSAGRYGRVMERYDGCVRPSATEGFALGTVADAASLLWRCGLHGYQVQPSVWQEVSQFAAKSFPRPGVAFADMHTALAHAAAGDDEGMTRLIAGLEERVVSGKSPAGGVTVALAKGARAFARGDYEAAYALLDPTANQVVRIGGSHAQREVFEDTLLECCLRTGRIERAEELLRVRTDRRPSPRDAYHLGRAHALAGRHDVATDAFSRAEQGWSDLGADADAPELLAITRMRSAMPRPSSTA